MWDKCLKLKLGTEWCNYTNTLALRLPEREWGNRASAEDRENSRVLQMKRPTAHGVWSCRGPNSTFFVILDLPLWLLQELPSPHSKVAFHDLLTWLTLPLMRCFPCYIYLVRPVKPVSNIIPTKHFNAWISPADFLQYKSQSCASLVPSLRQIRYDHVLS